MKEYLTLIINGNQGYAPSQVNPKMTLGELIDTLEDIALAYGRELPVITRNLDNAYGADYGVLRRIDFNEPQND